MGIPELDSSLVDNWRVAVVYEVPRSPVWSSEMRLLGFLADMRPDLIRLPGDNLWVEFNRYEMTERRAVMSGVETAHSALEFAGFRVPKIEEMMLYKQDAIDMHRTIGQELVAQDVTIIAQAVHHEMKRVERLCRGPLRADLL